MFRKKPETNEERLRRFILVTQLMFAQVLTFGALLLANVIKHWADPAEVEFYALIYSIPLMFSCIAGLVNLRRIKRLVLPPQESIQASTVVQSE